MAKIDWLYHRKSCTTCKKAEAFLLPTGTTVATRVDATKERIGPEDALKLLDGIDTVIAMRGKAVVKFSLKKDRPTDEELLAHLIGPTGNLRAPTARVKKTLLVGFEPETYGSVFC